MLLPYSDPCLAAMPAHPLRCCCIGVPLPWLGLGWGRLLPCFTLFWEDTHSTYSVVRNSTEDLSVLRLPCISIVEGQHIAPQPLAQLTLRVLH